MNIRQMYSVQLHKFGAGARKVIVDNTMKWIIVDEGSGEIPQRLALHVADESGPFQELM
jgi:hypothetical protein